MSSFVIDHVSHLIKTVDVVPGTTYGSDTDMVLDVRGMNRKDILIQNTGATGITYTIVASLDAENLHNPGQTGPIAEVEAARMVNNVDYDIIHTTEASLAPSAQIRIAFTDLYTYVKVRVKSAGTTAVTIKANASTN